jgi:hypothetical protein
MDTHVSRVQTASAASGRLVCWLESLIVGLGIPAAIWIISKLISLSIPAAVHGSAEQRFLLWILGGVDRRVGLCSRGLVRIANPRILFQKTLAFGA